MIKKFLNIKNNNKIRIILKKYEKIEKIGIFIKIFCLRNNEKLKIFFFLYIKNINYLRRNIEKNKINEKIGHYFQFFFV